jgi:hypothetical protein
MTFARKVAALAVAMVGLSTVFIGVGAASAATIGPCDLPEASVTLAQAEDFKAEVNPRACLDITFTDKCDGTTVVEMSNGAFSDNKFTVLTVELDGKEYTLKGGSDPNTETVVISPPANEDLQAWLVFRFTDKDGNTFTLRKKFGDPWTWEEPKACPTATPSPSPSASASPSPSAVPTSAAPSTTTAAPAPAQQGDDGGDLPVTGSALYGTIGTGVALVVAGIVALVVMARRRRVN